MKKIKKLIKKLNNRGSSVIMVVVAIGFIGIIVGALLSAAGYAYRLKMQNLNATDNFYYVEQAMQEIYAGVGANTIEEMKEAYTYTVENMVRFDPQIGTYVTLDDATANKMFKDKFMENIANSPYFAQGDARLAEVLEGYISNETVDLDNSKLSLDVQNDQIVIKNVTLTRVQEYDKSSGSGTYVQTISADIVISEPNFEVKFNNMMADYSAIYDYAMIADMGVQIIDNNTLDISGSIYAAADYYNKSYNEVDAGTYDKTYTVGGEEVKYSYSVAKVTNKDSSDDSTTDGYVNRVNDEGTAIYPFDGENVYSMNSGLYISNSTVSIMADNLVIPGTVAVMDNSELVVFGTAGNVSEVWADNIVLGGSSDIGTSTYTAGKTVITYECSEAIFGGNLYVRDDTEINARGAVFTLHGAYYGYGNSTSKDTRVFVPTVDKQNFQITEVDGTTNTTYNRGHYNSSSIVVNGEYATLDLSAASRIYLAGRSYIELSKTVTGSTPSENVYTETFVYNPVNVISDTETQFIRDYKTAESISIKSNQIMYSLSTYGEKGTYSVVYPVNAGTEGAVNGSVTTSYEGVKISGETPDVRLFFNKFFPADVFNHSIPCIAQNVEGKPVVLIDFATAYDILTDIDDTSSELTYVASAQSALEDIDSLDEYTLSFVTAYMEVLKANPDTELRNIVTFDEFNAGSVMLPGETDLLSGSVAKPIYSSGAITTKSNQAFTLVTKNDAQVLNSLLSGSGYNTNFAFPTDGTVVDTYGNPANAFELSEDLEMEYNYMKWNLAHYDSANVEKGYVSDLVLEKGEDNLTPINKYIVMKNITNTKKTTATGYTVWLSQGDVVVKGDSGEEHLTGLIIAKGDVTFDSSVKSFEGMIVAGGKIYVSSTLMDITASPNVCRGVIRDCITAGDVDILKVFKEYENYTADGSGGPGSGGTSTAVSIEAIDYTDVVSMSNWMKNVGGDYDGTKTP